MRLAGLAIRSFRVVVDSSFPLDPFVVLFGANSTGKSTVLDTLRLMLDPPDEDEAKKVRLPDAILVVELDFTEIPGHPDAEAWGHLLTLQSVEEVSGHESPWGTPPLSATVDSDLVSQINQLPVDEAIEVIAEWLADASTDRPEDRRVVAEHCLRTRYLAITPTTIYHYLPASNRVPDNVIQAAGRLRVPTAESPDMVELWADGIRTASEVVGPALALRPEPTLHLPGAVVLDTDPRGIESEVRDALVVAHDTLFSYVSVLKLFDQILISTRSTRVGEALLDAWLETESVDPPGEADLAAAMAAGEFQLSAQIPEKLMRAKVAIDLDGFVAATHYDPHAWYRVKRLSALKWGA